MNIFVFCKKLLEIEHVLPEGYRNIDDVFSINVKMGKIESIYVFSNGINFQPIYNLPSPIIMLYSIDSNLVLTEEDLSDISIVCLSYPHQQNFPILDLVSKRLVNDGVFLA